jgi:hypothetical protein
LQADPAVSQPLMNPTDADFEALLQDILNERQE